MIPLDSVKTQPSKQAVALRGPDSYNVDIMFPEACSSDLIRQISNLTIDSGGELLYQHQYLCHLNILGPGDEW